MSTPGQTGPARPRGDVLFLIVLIMLACIVAFLWLSDPSHSDDGKSRVGWPALKGHKP